MANKNDGILSNSYDTTNAMNNCSNNNETEGSSSSTTSSSTMAITTHHNDINNQQHYHHGSLSPSSEATEDNNLCCGGGIQQQQQQNNRKSDLKSRNLDRNFGGGDDIGNYENIRATYRNLLATAPLIEQQTRREENPFSFKHFLNRDTNTVSSATATISVTTSSTVSTASSSAAATATAFSNNETNFNNSTNSNNNSHSINTEELNNSIYSKNSKISNDYETNNKLPGSPSITTAASSTHLSSSSLSNSGNSMSNKTSTGARPKIPQSATISSPNDINIHYPLHNQQQQSSSSQHQQQHSLPPSSISITSMSSLIGSGGSASELCKMKRSPRFSSFDSQASLAEYAGSGLNDYQDDIQQFGHTSFLSECNDLEEDVIKQRRKNLSMKPRRSRTSRLPQSSSDSKNYPLGGVSGIGGPRPNSEFSNVLPDFVQDHYMDQWYYNDINLSSPPNSPISSPVDFIEDLPCGMGGNGGGGVSGNNNGLGGLDNLPNTIEKCQTLPDFLSDGPIIHSSARLADIATGLPPDLDSPEDNSPSLQLSRLRLENDRLRRELDESRLALAEQTRRNSELERCLEQARNVELLKAYYEKKSSSNSNDKSDENLEQNKARDAAAQSQISKLKQQIKQLTTEVETLKRENESLREEGAVGGDRVTKRPSRTQQLSRDLMRAASNAENNLRQLLSGVENLRLMAANIENMDRIPINSTNQANPSVNDEYLSDSDLDLDNFTGPTL